MERYVRSQDPAVAGIGLAEVRHKPWKFDRDLLARAVLPVVEQLNVLDGHDIGIGPQLGSYSRRRRNQVEVGHEAPVPGCDGLALVGAAENLHYDFILSRV